MGFRFIEPARKIKDLKMGEGFKTNGRTVCQSDINLFCGLVGDPHPLHLSEMDAAESRMRRIIAPAPLIKSMAIGLMAQTHWLTPILDVFVGAGEWRVEKPVFPSDTIYAMVTPAELTTTSKGGNLLEILVEVYARRGAADAASAEDPRVMRFNLRFLVSDPT